MHLILADTFFREVAENTLDNPRAKCYIKQALIHKAHARVVELADSLDSGSSVHYGRAGSSPASRTKWTKVGVLNSFLRLSNTPTLVLWEKALIFEALPFLMYSLVIHIAKIKVARLVVENRKKPSFEPFVQINLLTLSFAHGAIRTHPVSCG